MRSIAVDEDTFTHKHTCEPHKQSEFKAKAAKSQGEAMHEARVSVRADHPIFFVCQSVCMSVCSPVCVRVCVRESLAGCLQLSLESIQAITHTLPKERASDRFY